MTIKDIAAVDKALKKEFKAHAAPVIELIEAQTHDPFCVLVGTIISARTKDACTAGAVKRLFNAETRRHGGFCVETLERLSQREIEKLIYPVGFYHDKARHLKALPQALVEFFPEGLDHAADGLKDVAGYNHLVERLCQLPGVGRKTANLTVAVGYDLPAVCVDVHVHRICNRLGLLKTKTPFETEMKLREIVPVKYWKTWNSHLVSFGQTRCAPRGPRCADCPIRRYCRMEN